MEKFNGILTHQTLSDEDYKRMMSLPINEINKYSDLGIKIVKDSQSLLNEMAQSIVKNITVKNIAGEQIKIILPVGPIGQYPILARICNRKKINLSNVWIFFMDEYLDWEGKLIPESHPLSFRGIMKNKFFKLLDKGLEYNRRQTIWPDPVNLDYYEDKIHELGGIDVCFGGIGYHGHIAFNEPPNTYYGRMTIKKFLDSSTRVVNLNSDTIVVNSLKNIGGNCYSVPPKAITIGMRSVINSKRIELYCASMGLEWKANVFRVTCMHPPTLDWPSTLLQFHNDPRNNVLVVADEKIAKPLKITNA